MKIAWYWFYGHLQLQSWSRSTFGYQVFSDCMPYVGFTGRQPWKKLDIISTPIYGPDMLTQKWAQRAHFYFLPLMRCRYTRYMKWNFQFRPLGRARGGQSWNTKSVNNRQFFQNNKLLHEHSPSKCSSRNAASLGNMAGLEKSINRSYFVFPK